MINGNHIRDAIDSVEQAIEQVRKNTGKIRMTDEDVGHLLDLARIVTDYRDNAIMAYRKNATGRATGKAFGLTGARVSQICNNVRERN